MRNKLKIFNDPVYGFIQIPNSLLFDIIEDAYFQRLRRIAQMGLSSMVYPGAIHTRFHHALGCVFLMKKAVNVLRLKQVEISEEEEEALYIAILLHDIGHGPFSHALENSIVNGISHEEISLKFMTELNKKFNGKLNLAIKIFEGTYPRKFLCQLISSQLDIDRLDYLKRDSFFTGVTEGNISSDRLIVMMDVANDELVIEQKGIYSVEKFLIARKFMYWQVYLHKTGLVAEHLLVSTLKRAKELSENGVELFASNTLQFFLKNKITRENFTNDVLEMFSKLDDYDILSAVKEWMHHEDKVLSLLSKMIIERKLLKVEVCNKAINHVQLVKKREKFKQKLNLNETEIEYFVFLQEIKNQAYTLENPISIVNKKRKLKDITKASEQLNLQSLTKPIIKYIFCYPK